MASMSVRQILQSAQYALLRYETEHVPCTGITAVTRQERRVFRRGVMIAPWHERLGAARSSLDAGRVVATGERLTVEIGGVTRNAQILVSCDDASMPVLYLALEGCFQGLKTPYDTSELARDALIFGLLVARLIVVYGPGPRWVSGADWQSVPALELLGQRIPTLLILHNDYDAYLGAAASAFAEFTMFLGDQTALQIGMRRADVVGAVSQGFAAGLATDPLHRRVLAPHLQDLVSRVVGIDNAVFAPPSPEYQSLSQLIRENPIQGLNRLNELKQAARGRLPEPLRGLSQGRTVIVSMGRRSSQKLHEVVACAAEACLKMACAANVLFVFATTDGDPGADDRLARLSDLARKAPDFVISIDGRIDYYADLLAVADFNVMCSLWEPFGSAYEGLAVPIARAVDGLAAQVSGRDPVGAAAALQSKWHPGEPATGYLFREDELEDPVEQERQLQALLTQSPSPENLLFRRMVAALTATLVQAVAWKEADLSGWAQLVGRALDQQMAWSWKENFAMQLALMRDAMNRRAS